MKSTLYEHRAFSDGSNSSTLPPSLRFGMGGSRVPFRATPQRLLCHCHGRFNEAQTQCNSGTFL